MIKDSIHQEYITIVNSKYVVYACNIRALLYIKKILSYPKGIVDKNKIYRGLQYPTFSKGQTIHTENNYGNIGSELYFRVHIPNRYIKNISPNSGRIHLLLKLTWNILQNRALVRSQNQSWHFFFPLLFRAAPPGMWRFQSQGSNWSYSC